ncbi:MAG TPA: PqqD family protein [Thermoanaerobaculia bacterium]|nr:PqqD family protein [Thermoanaerobaculia bacterium]
MPRFYADLRNIFVEWTVGLSIVSDSNPRRYRRSADVVCRQVGSESILVPIRNNVGNLDSIFTLSPVAARIWNLIDGTRDADAIADDVTREFEVDRDTAAADVAELLSSLEEVSLILSAD